MAKKILGDDPRNPKLLGILLIFLAFYLFIGYVSYFVTYSVDQSLIDQYGSDVLFHDVRHASTNEGIQNWLGRLGALTSYFLIDGLFGVPSIGIIYLLFQYGFGIISEVPLGRFSTRFRSTVLWMVGFSVLFGYIFQLSGFAWGGAFGREVSTWLISLLGNIGMFFLVILFALFLIVWSYNPDLKGLTVDKAIENIKIFFLSFWDDRYRSGRFSIRRAISLPEEAPERTEIRPNTANNNAPSLAPRRAGERNAIEEALDLPPSVQVPSTSEPTTLTLVTDEDDDIDENDVVELMKRDAATSGKKPTLRVGDAALEIEETTPPPSVLEVETTVTLPQSPLPTGEQGALFETTATTPSITVNRGDLSTPYDPTLDISGYEYPVLPLLESYEEQKVEIDRAELEQNKDQIIETLLNYKIEITKIRATIGPTVTLYEIVPAPGVRISRIKNLEDDIALSLAALGIRIIAPIPGKGTIGIEVPNKSKQVVSLREVFSSDRFRKTDADLPIALGKNISNEPIIVDLAKMPHLLIAGATGQGKSVGINAVLMSLLYKKHPSQLKLVLIDPKKVELSPYAKIENHFLAYLPDQLEPIITDTSKVVQTLNSLCVEMDNRYDLLKKAQARNIKEYNEKFVARKLNPERGHRYLPFIVLVIDEFADLIMTAGKEVELPIGRLAQLARAIGIHLIIATQRPSVNIITGVIKANFPARIAFKVSSKVDSRTILDNSGAEQLIGRGDLLLSFGSDIIRLQCAFVDTPEVERVIDFIAQQPGFAQPYFLPEFFGGETDHKVGAVDMNDLDDMLEDAARLVVQNQHGSTSMIQRRLKLGYNRAGRIMDQLEALGIVGPSEGSKPREVLVHDEMELERHLQEVRNKRFS